jgi:hypothetical protein
MRLNQLLHKTDPLAVLGSNLRLHIAQKKLNGNLHRSIILANGGKYWIYEYLFAKKDRANIEEADSKVKCNTCKPRKVSRCKHHPDATNNSNPKTA